MGEKLCPECQIDLPESFCEECKKTREADEVFTINGRQVCRYCIAAKAKRGQSAS